MDDLIDAITSGKYPSPPARDLYLVSKGKPQKELVTRFLKWILSDGQKFVNEAGYIALSKEKISQEQKRVE
jgi:phosphate transport system substrate-binding protein